ncbi:MAG: hydroxymethylglutaryl-CoA reductase, degradative [archaeon]|jgi:hydroxymethylglutaryl-CoA reductase|nr:hydroxymethylglutaryl-CoA reductase, degradative [archaeon]
MGSSEIHKFYKKSREERIALVKEFAELSDEEATLLGTNSVLSFETSDKMIENVVGMQQLPLGIATNFLIDGADCLIPMAVEEPSVVAAASKVAGIARTAGGFTTESDEPIMIGQIALVGVEDFEKAKSTIIGKKAELLEKAKGIDPVLVKFGGGPRDIEVHERQAKSGKIVMVHLLVDVRDAMGANAVNTMVESIASDIEELSGGKSRLRIISNLAVHRKARAKAVFSKEAIEESFKGKDTGKTTEEIIDAIIEVYEVAEADQFRATTHNKGVMNGIDAVAIACGQDWRAIEAGAHSFAAFETKYRPLTKYYKDDAGNLVGEIELPLAVGLVGGAVKTNPLAGVCLKLLKVKTAQELAEKIAAVGLAQNFAAIREIATRGIQAGHMALHGKNIAVMAGAKPEEIEAVSAKMAEEKNIRVNRAKEILEEMRK